MCTSERYCFAGALADVQDILDVRFTTTKVDDHYTFEAKQDLKLDCLEAEIIAVCAPSDEVNYLLRLEVRMRAGADDQEHGLDLQDMILAGEFLRRASVVMCEAGELNGLTFPIEDVHRAMSGVEESKKMAKSLFELLRGVGEHQEDDENIH